MPELSETLSTPVEEAGDVVVFGAGSAGIGAALAAARRGCRVTLVDPAGFPGGTMVSGLPLLGAHDGLRNVVGGIYAEIGSRLEQRGGREIDRYSPTAWHVDHEKLKVLLIEMLAEAGVALRLHTLLARAVVAEQRIAYAVTEGQGGRRALRAPLFIDASGDADLAHHAGVPTEKGRRDGATQAMTLMFGVGGIDLDAFSAWGGYQRLEESWREISERGNFRNPRRISLSQMWGPTSRVGERAFNATRVLAADGTDAASLSRAEVDGRLQVWEFMERFLRPHIPGFGRAFVAWTSAKIGVRETRRILGEYVLTADDILRFRDFPDAVVYGSYPIDIHSPLGDGTDFRDAEFYGGRHWSIPYRSLVPRNIDNLLVAGRCLSATHEALSAVRVMASTVAMGEAVGAAAALCRERGCAPRDLSPAVLRADLAAHGAWLGADGPAAVGHRRGAGDVEGRSPSCGGDAPAQ